MDSTQLLWLAMGLVAGIIIITVGRRLFGATRPTAECVHCGATKMKEIHRETFDSRTVEVGNGGRSFGGDIRLQLDQEVTYHCNRCHKESRISMTKTQ